jgi:hypothetical protein
LHPRDLVPLASTCQSLNTSLCLHKPNCRTNLLTKTLCPGHGFKIRREEHNVLDERSDEAHTSWSSTFPSKKSAFVKFHQCGGNNPRSEIESRPCVRYCMNTCNECRIHVTYQSLVEDPRSDLDNQRWWAGHILLSGTTFQLLPPTSSDIYDVETATTDARWNEPIETMLPNHDAGRIGVAIMDR